MIKPDKRQRCALWVSRMCVRRSRRLHLGPGLAWSGISFRAAFTAWSATSEVALPMSLWWALEDLKDANAGNKPRSEYDGFAASVLEKLEGFMVHGRVPEDGNV